MNANLMVVAVIAALATGGVYGQTYPDKPIRILTAAAGGGNDFAARLIAQGISGPLGKPVIVDNRASLLAVELASKAPADGYSLLLSGESLWITPMVKKLPYHVNDFSPIVLVSKEVRVVAIHPSVAAKSVKELIALAKAKPGQLNYASSGIGSTGQLAAELFKSMAGVDIVLINYKGTGPALNALLANEVQLLFANSTSATAHMKSGKLRVLAVTTLQPSPLFPGLPTLAASGLPGFEILNVTGIWAPAKTPAAIINRLNQEVVRFVNSVEVKEQFLTIGVEVVGSSPEEFASFIKSDMARMGKVVKDAGIKDE